MIRQIGAVAIGRNEGQRLRGCLQSLLGQVGQIVYVDSGSTDGSQELARNLGVEVVELDPSMPFTAARARNAGFARLMEISPQVHFVQFVDGDCQVESGWVEAAVRHLQARPDVAATCGHRREIRPEASIYNRLCQLEWASKPTGPISETGGDFVIRADAFEQVRGFVPQVIAGEEPEMCVRLSQRGWGLTRLDQPMTAHDAAMTRFVQWWRRMVRAGHAYAEGAWMHGSSPQRHCVRESRSIWTYGLALPLLALLLAWSTSGLSLLVLFLLIYPVLFLRVWRHVVRQRRMKRWDAVIWSASCLLSKFPGAVGQLKFVTAKLYGGRSELIEYKRVGTA